jgi:PAS domain S-box-containing protein
MGDDEMRAGTITPEAAMDFLEILSQNLISGVSILDQDLNYQFISQAVYKQLGVTRDDLRPGHSLAYCHNLMMEKGLLTPELLETQKLSSDVQRQQKLENNDTSARMVELGDGTTHRFLRKTLSDGRTVSIASDVTELVNAERRLNKALTLGRSGYWSFDIAAKTYDISHGMKSYYGPELIEKAETTGIMTLVHPEDRAKYRAALKDALSGKDRFNVSCRAVSANTRENWFRTNGEIIRDAEGRPTRIEAFVTDVTKDRKVAKELERAKDDAIAASHAKSEFLANMSHEIRTPMNGILGMAELLANSDIGDRQRDFVNVINNSASALLTIINDILDFSKIEAGAFEIDPMPFNLKTSIEDVVSLLRAKAQDKGLELIINYPTDQARGFIGDAGRLRQVITNLIGNAVKFTETGHITIDVDISSTHEGIAVCDVKVSDTGIGISPEKMDRIFDKFTQADGSTTRVYGGTGLGLTISKHIVEMMGGRMQVSSTFGEGSSFGFRIPLPLDANAQDEAFDILRISGKRVLIIDDIETNRTLFSEQMQAWGMVPDVALDGVDALGKLRAAHKANAPYDLLLLDYLMPGLNGQEFAQILHQAPDLGHVPIIMLSSCDQPVSSQDLQDIGIDSYLVKPVRERRLFDTIVRGLSKPMPAQDEVTKPVVSIQPRKEKPRLEILVAEDFALNQDVVRLMLDDTPFRPVFANNGEEAIKMFMAAPDRFPVILMDVSMPVMDGYQATSRIRAFEAETERKAIPVIALTGHALKNDRQDCLNAGMTDYLTKPVKQVQLIEKLEEYSGKAIALSRSA